MAAVVEDFDEENSLRSKPSIVTVVRPFAQSSSSRKETSLLSVAGRFVDDDDVFVVVDVVALLCIGCNTTIRPP